MMKNNSVQFQRHSIRYMGYDYSLKGLYFITICCHHRACLFGEIKNGQIKLNNAGQMIEKWYYEIENKYPDKQCHEMIVMPNHFHCIIENIPTTRIIMGAHVGAPLRGRPKNDKYGLKNQYGSDNIKYNATIGDVMDWFKTMTTNEYIRGVKNIGWQPFDKKLWQRSYYDHIILNEQSYLKISDYIHNNPSNWNKDQLK